MFILFFYSIENIIIARFLQKKKMKIASLAHAVFFILFGIYLFFVPFGPYSWFEQLFISEDIYNLLSEVITEPIQISYYSFSIYSIVSLTMLIILIISAALIGVLIIEDIILTDLKKDEKEEETKKYNEKYNFSKVNKIFILNCAFRN